MNILLLPTEILQYIIGGGFLNNTDIANVAEAVKDRPELIERLRLIPLMKTQITYVFQHDDALPIIDRLSFYELQQLTRCTDEYDPWELDDITIIDQVMCEVLQTVGEKWQDFFDVLSLNYVHVSMICFDIFRWQNQLKYDDDGPLSKYNHSLSAKYVVDNHLLLNVLAHYITSCKCEECLKRLYVSDSYDRHMLLYLLQGMAMYNERCIRPDIIQMLVPAYTRLDDPGFNFVNNTLNELKMLECRMIYFLKNNKDEYLKFKKCVNYIQEQCHMEILPDIYIVDYMLDFNEADINTDLIDHTREAWAFYREL